MPFAFGIGRRSPTELYSRSTKQPQLNVGKKKNSESTKEKLSGPEPRKFFIRGDKYWDIISSSVPLVTRLGSGALTAGWSVKIAKNAAYNAGAPPVKPEDQTYSFLRLFNLEIQESCTDFRSRPRKPLILYEFQGCPFCAKVREAITILDLDVLFKPCPQDGPTFRPLAISKGGKKQFPYLEDPNTRTEMYESDDIIRYLYETYGPLPKNNNAGASSLKVGDKQAPMVRVNPKPGFSTTLTTALGLALRGGKGSRYDVESNTYNFKNGDMQPIEFWAYEASPFCRIVKEVLNELEIPHIQRTCARGSPKRDILLQKVGHFQVPYIEDPNTGVKMFESAEIIDYLKKQYTGVINA